MRRPLRFYTTIAYLIALVAGLVLAAFDVLSAPGMFRVIVIGGSVWFILAVGEGLVRGARRFQADVKAHEAKRVELMAAIKRNDELFEKARADGKELERQLAAISEAKVGRAAEDIRAGETVEFDQKTRMVRRARPPLPPLTPEERGPLH